jgi:hypothetical protein
MSTNMAPHIAGKNTAVQKFGVIVFERKAHFLSIEVTSN